MNKPFFSIVIPCYNYGHLLSRAIDSILCQTNTNFEIIIVNDGSTDKSQEVSQHYANNNQQIRYILQRNAGPAAARNHGIREATGDYLIFLDADDTLEDKALSKIEKVLKSNRNIECLIGGHTSIFTDGTSKYTPPPQLHESAEKCFIGYLEKKIRVCNGAMVIARRVFDTLSFPEELRSCEDIPFFAHTLLFHKCQSIDAPIANIYKHPDSLRHNHVAASLYRIMAVEKTFTKALPDSLLQLNKKFISKGYLSLFRSHYLATDFQSARSFYRKAIYIYPVHLLNISYLRKFLRSLKINIRKS